MGNNRLDSITDQPGDSYDPNYFASLFAIEDRHFWFKARNRVISVLVSQITNTLAPGYRVLEVGCGTGNVLQFLSKLCPSGAVVGMDLFAEGLRYARRRAACSLVQGDMHAPPFSRPFEMIGIFDVLEHLCDDVQVLKALCTLLAPNGTLLLTVPAHQSLWSYFDEAARHCRRYAVAELEHKLATAGYQVEYLTQYMASIFPLVWLERWVKTRTASLSADKTDQLYHLASSELQIVPLVNSLLVWLLSQEAHAIARRWRLPLGTSLLAVAHKLG